MVFLGSLLLWGLSLLAGCHSAFINRTSCPSAEPPKALRPRIEIRAVLIRCPTKERSNTYQNRGSDAVPVSLSRFKEVLHFYGYDKDEPLLHSEVTNCRRKLVVTIKLSTCGRLKKDVEYVVIDHVYDPLLKDKARLLNPIVLKLAQKPVEEAYPLIIQHIVNGKAFEEIMQKEITPHYEGCHSSPHNSTCGVSYFEGDPVPFSEGFCCSCDTFVNAKRQPMIFEGHAPRQDIADSPESGNFPQALVEPPPNKKLKFASYKDILNNCSSKILNVRKVLCKRSIENEQSISGFLADHGQQSHENYPPYSNKLQSSQENILSVLGETVNLNKKNTEYTHLNSETENTATNHKSEAPLKRRNISKIKQLEAISPPIETMQTGTGYTSSQEKPSKKPHSSTVEKRNMKCGSGICLQMRNMNKDQKLLKSIPLTSSQTQEFLENHSLNLKTLPKIPHERNRVDLGDPTNEGFQSFKKYLFNTGNLTNNLRKRENARKNCRLWSPDDWSAKGVVAPKHFPRPESLPILPIFPNSYYNNPPLEPGKGFSRKDFTRLHGSDPWACIGDGRVQPPYKVGFPKSPKKFFHQLKKRTGLQCLSLFGKNRNETKNDYSNNFKLVSTIILPHQKNTVKQNSNSDHTFEPKTTSHKNKILYKKSIKAKSRNKKLRNVTEKPTALRKWVSLSNIFTGKKNGNGNVSFEDSVLKTLQYDNPDQIQSLQTLFVYPTRKKNNNVRKKIGLDTISFHDSINAETEESIRHKAPIDSQTKEYDGDLEVDDDTLDSLIKQFTVDDFDCIANIINSSQLWSTKLKEDVLNRDNEIRKALQDLLRNLSSEDIYTIHTDNSNPLKEKNIHIDNKLKPLEVLNPVKEDLDKDIIEMSSEDNQTEDGVTVESVCDKEEDSAFETTKDRVRRQVGSNGAQIRGGQSCVDRFTPPRVDPIAYHESAHCLRFSDLWYTVYRLKDPFLVHDVSLEILEKHCTEGFPHHWELLTEGFHAALGTFSRRVTNRDRTIVFSYTPLSQFDTLGHDYCFNPTITTILVPRPVAPALQHMYPQAHDNARRYLLVRQEDISFTGDECSRAGVSFPAFSRQPERCNKPKGSCLENQPIDLWEHDIKLKEEKQRGKYFLENYVSISEDGFRHVGKSEYLSIDYSGFYSSVVEIEIQADRNAILRSDGVPAQLSEVYVDSSCNQNTRITIKVTNIGLISSKFRPRISNCPTTIPVVWGQQVGPYVYIPPQHVHIFILTLYGALPASRFHCSIDILNAKDQIVATRRIRIQRFDRCLCMWHCLCACAASVDGFACIPMSLDHYHAAGFYGSIPIDTELSYEEGVKTNSISKYSGFFFRVLPILLFLHLILLLFGLLKAIIGLLCFRKVAELCLEHVCPNFAKRVKTLDTLAFTTIVVERDCETGKVTVARAYDCKYLCATLPIRLLEFYYNTICFLVAPGIILLYLMKACCCCFFGCLKKIKSKQRSYQKSDEWRDNEEEGDQATSAYFMEDLRGLEDELGIKFVTESDEEPISKPSRSLKSDPSYRLWNNFKSLTTSYWVKNETFKTQKRKSSHKKKNKKKMSFDDELKRNVNVSVCTSKISAYTATIKGSGNKHTSNFNCYTNLNMESVSSKPPFYSHSHSIASTEQVPPAIHSEDVSIEEPRTPPRFAQWRPQWVKGESFPNHNNILIQETMPNEPLLNEYIQQQTDNEDFTCVQENGLQDNVYSHTTIGSENMFSEDKAIDGLSSNDEQHSEESLMVYTVSLVTEMQSNVSSKNSCISANAYCSDEDLECTCHNEGTYNIYCSSLQSDRENIVFSSSAPGVTLAQTSTECPNFRSIDNYSGINHLEKISAQSDNTYKDKIANSNDRQDNRRGIQSNFLPSYHHEYVNATDITRIAETAHQNQIVTMNEFNIDNHGKTTENETKQIISERLMNDMTSENEINFKNNLANTRQSDPMVGDDNYHMDHVLRKISSLGGKDKNKYVISDEVRLTPIKREEDKDGVPDINLKDCHTNTNDDIVLGKTPKIYNTNSPKSNLTNCVNLNEEEFSIHYGKEEQTAIQIPIQKLSPIADGTDNTQDKEEMAMISKLDVNWDGHDIHSRKEEQTTNIIGNNDDGDSIYAQKDYENIIEPNTTQKDSTKQKEHFETLGESDMERNISIKKENGCLNEENVTYNFALIDCYKPGTHSANSYVNSIQSANVDCIGDELKIKEIPTTDQEPQSRNMGMKTKMEGELLHARCVYRRFNKSIGGVLNDFGKAYCIKGQYFTTNGVKIQPPRNLFANAFTEIYSTVEEACQNIMVSPTAFVVNQNT